MKTFKRIIAVVLLASLLAGFIPVDATPKAYAETPDASVVKAEGFDAYPETAAELAAQGKTLEEGGWQYVALPGTDYAAVVGYAGEASAELSMPDVLGGLDVVAVAPGALSAQKQVETLYIPGNVRAIGAAALPRGAAVKAMNASYASFWAAENGYAFVNASTYDFREGVVDLSDVRVENFVRVSANEVWLRPLEATRLKVGSFFFLIDPDNAYQISYYKVTGTAQGRLGFTVFSCETPEVDSVLNYYKGTDEVMVPDMSSLVLYEGVTLDGGDEVTGSSLSNGYSSTNNLNFKFSYKGSVGDNGKISVSGGYT